MSNRALSPVVATVLLIVVTLVLAGTVGTVALNSTLLREPTQVAISVSADADADHLTFAHHAGNSLLVDGLDVHISMNRTPLERQPPIPFFSATGFQPGPTGPFNSATNSSWSTGETASVELAGTNAPLLESSDEVVIRISVGGALVAEVETTAS